MWRKKKTCSRWWERYMTQEDTPSKMGFCQHRNGGDGAAGEEREGSERVDMRSTAEPYSLSCQQDTWKTPVDSNEGIKMARREVRSRFRCRKVKNWRKKKSCWRRNNSYACSLREEGERWEKRLEDEFLVALSSAGNPTLTWPVAYHFTYLLYLW